MGWVAVLWVGTAIHILKMKIQTRKTNMKRIILTALTALAISARASLYTTGSIPDGNPTGVAFTGTYDQATAGFTVSSLIISLNISGGYNGDLYAYLAAPNGTLVMLMNQPGMAVNGFGASGAGMNITLQDVGAANGNIQNETSGSVLSGSCNAAASLSGFNGSVADGTWTLFFADEVSGGGTSTLNSWSLGITAVPEPVNVALGVFGGLFAIAGLIKIRRRKKAA
jgi:subtilisin-like proprotein convertase family protein